MDEEFEVFYELCDQGLFRKLYTGAWETVPGKRIIALHNDERWRVMIFFDSITDKRWRTAQCIRVEDGTVRDISLRYLQQIVEPE